VLRKIFGPKRDKVTGERIELHNDEIKDLCCLPNSFRMIKSRIMRWARNIACVGERRGTFRVLVG
jgi:hypothetical protein